MGNNKLYMLLFLLHVQLVFPLFSATAEEENQADTYCEADTYARYLPSRSVESTSGKVEVVESEAEYRYGFKVAGKLPVKFSLTTQYIGIEDTLRTVELPSHLNGLSTDLETTLPFFKVDKTYLRFGVSPSFYDDDWNFESSSFRIPSRYYLIYLPNAKLTYIAGVAVYPDYEDEVLPILGLIYKPNDRLTFNLVPKRPNISYSLNGRATLFVEGGRAFNSEFEVTRSGAKNTVLRYKETRVGAGIKYKINKSIEASVSGGGVFGRSLKYRDNEGGKVSIKDGAYTELRVEVKP